MSKKTAFSLLITVITFILLYIGMSFDVDDNLLRIDKEFLNNTDSLSTYSREVLLDDYDELWQYIQDYHPKEFTDEEKLISLYEQNRKLITEGLTEVEFFRIVTPIVASINCGHTYIDLPKEINEKLYFIEGYFPMEVKTIDGSAYITNHLEVDEIQNGSKILEINNRNLDDILKVMMDNISSDGRNETYKYQHISNSFSELYFKFIEATDTYKIRYETMNQEIKEVNIDSAQYFKKIIKTEEVPYQFILQDNYAILTLKSFRPSDDWTLENYIEFIDSVFFKIEDKKIDNLILDVRDNRGGDPRITSHLFSYLGKYEQQYFSDNSPDVFKDLKKKIDFNEPHYSGKLYVLVNGYCFSGSGHLIALLKHQGIGTIIGEEIGSSYKCMDSSWYFELKNTKLLFRCATEIWNVEVDGFSDGVGILPDVYKVKTLEDFISGSDSVLEKAIELIQLKGD